MEEELERAAANLKTPEDIMDFFREFISYGCVSSDGIRYEDSLGGAEFREKYRTLSLEDSLKEKIGACIEQTNITKYLLTQMNIKNRTFCVKGFNEVHQAPDDLYLVHCFTLAYIDGKVLNIEYSDSELRGIYVYESEEDAISQSYALFGGKFRKHGATETSLYAYTPYIPGGLTFDEFNRYISENGRKLEI